MANYYRHFIKNFATIAKPLHQATEKQAHFKWTERCAQAFNQLKDNLTSTPILAMPDWTKPFILDTDACETGIGAVLSQSSMDSSEHVIAYASRLLTKPERNYCVMCKELLAVVTFLNHFRHYLISKPFTIRTDHGTLIWLQNFRSPEGQLARWLEKLQEYQFTILGVGTTMQMLYPECHASNVEEVMPHRLQPSHLRIQLVAFPWMRCVNSN